MNDSMLPGDRSESPRSGSPSDSPESGGSGGAGSRGSGGGFARSATMAVGRGTLLIGLAVILGILLLQVVDPGPDGSSASTGTTTTTAAAGSSSSTAAGETTVPGGEATTAVTTAASGAKPPSEVSVIVFNGSNAAGVASNATDKLKAAGYKTLTPTDAQTKQVGTTATCKADFKANAPGIAEVVGGRVVDYPSNPTSAAASADCFVIIGS